MNAPATFATPILHPATAYQATLARLLNDYRDEERGWERVEGFATHWAEPLARAAYAKQAAAHIAAMDAIKAEITARFPGYARRNFA